MKRSFTLSIMAFLLMMTTIVWGQVRTDVTDELTRDLIGVTGTTYSTWSGVTSNSDAVYAGQSAGGNSSIQLRSNNNNSGIITTASGGTVTGISVTWNSNTSNGRTLNVYGKSSAYSDATDLYNASTQGTLIGTIVCGTSTELSVSDQYEYIGLRSASGAMYLTEIDITWSTGGTQQNVATPTFSPAAGTYTEAQQVTINCNTDGATIYYTTDGTTPTVDTLSINGTVYTSPIEISETTTVKAIGVKEGYNNSSVATATYTIVQTSALTTIAEIWDFAESVGTTATLANVTFNNWYVTGIRNSQVCVSDGQYGFVIYQSSHGFTAGDMLSGTVACNVLMYQNHYAELTGVHASDLTVVSGQEMPMLTTTIDALQVRNYGTPINLGTLTYNGTAFVDDNDNTITPYNNFNLSPNPLNDLVTGTQYNIKGVSIIYWSGSGQTQQIAPRSADDFEEVVVVETVATPTFSPEGGAYTGEVDVTITCDTDGATIYYTLDGTDPTYDVTSINGTEYTAPIAISETTTVKAIGVKEGYENSNIATADYTINTPLPTLTFNKLASHFDVNDNGVYMIVDTDGSYALTSANGSTSAPTAVSVTIEDDAITGEIDEDLQWNITAVEGGYKISPISNPEVFLYTTNTNNGVRVGTNENNVWSFDITDTLKPNYHGFKNVAHSRYLGVYNNADWRSYTSINNNIEYTHIEIFVLGEAPVHTYYNVSVSAGISNGTVTVSDTLAEAGDVIIVTATPDYGYELETVTYSYAGVTPIDITGTMQFQMPDADVTVYATFSEVVLETVATPTFSPAEGSYTESVDVTIECETEGAIIYYTLDGTDPVYEATNINGTEYTAPIAISETTTVKAIGVKEGYNNSAIATAVYTIEPAIIVITIAEARALANDEYALVQGIVTFIDGKNVYIQDETAGIDLYLNANAPGTLALGDMVMAYGKKTVYKGLVELNGIDANDASQFSVLSTGNELPVAVKTIAEITEDFSGANMLQSTRVQIVEAIIGTINTSSNTPISQGDNTINIYKMPVVEGLLAGDIVTVTGVIGCFNTIQLRVATANDVIYEHPQVETVATPTFTPAAGTYYEEISVEISCETEGATIYYTLDGTDPTYDVTSINGTEYTAPIAISETTTVKAIGVKEGYDNSAVATAEYTFTEPPTPSEYVRITDLSQLSDGSKVVFAARFDGNANSYYAMTAVASGKPTGVLFTSAMDDGETLPSTIADEDTTYYWTVSIYDGNYTFTNFSGNVLGYSSGTNFATGGNNTAWSIEYAVSGGSAMVPNYGGYVIKNVNNNGRGIALNNNHNFGPYATSNMTSENYNFFLDLFATEGTGVLTCATPVITPASGTYFEEQTVEITCSTGDATIYYTLDGSDPTANSNVYTSEIVISENVTVKAIAIKEGYENSNIATAEYIIILDAVTIFNQDWEGGMNGWTFVTVEGGNAWTIATYSNNHYAYANGYNGGVNEQWCISPAFDLITYTNASLSFRNAKNYNGPDLQVYFSNDYDGENPVTATWTELDFNKSTGSFSWAESGIIDLANFSGESCYIGFKYTSTETSAAAWEVDDIVLMGFTSEPYLTVTPSALSGFTYIVGNGPSQVQTFTVSGGNLPPAPGGATGGITITCSNTHYELSLDGEEFWPYTIGIQATGTLEPTTVYVRLEAGLYVGQWDGVVTLEDGGTTATVSVSGAVIEEPVPGDNWNRIYALSNLHDGDQVILAARYDATIGNGYYAMTAGVSGKPDGVLFTSEDNGGVEILPVEIASESETYLWNVILNDTIITLVNAAGDSLGYSSSTNFSGNVNTEWNIAVATSGENAMIPNYTGFVITNGTTTNRGIAKNSSNKFGAYATSNMNNADYNFYLDIFVQGGVVTPTVATPVFSMASGTYYEAIEVEITCATEGATIYYTTDGSDPTAESEVYTEALIIEESTTMKAIALKEGYDDSGIASASYVIMSDIQVILSQDWEGDMNGWTFVTVEGNKPWTIATYGGNKYANANGYNDTINNEQWCISPVFNLDARTEHNVILTFRNAMKFDGPALELLFSNDYNGSDPDDATWEPLSFIASEGNYVWTESGEISLNTFSGESCYIGFRYTSTLDDGAASWEIDDILLVADMSDAPYLSATPNSVSGLTHVAGQGPSEAQTFVVTGGNLPEGFLTLTLDNSDFEISLDGELYTCASITIPVYEPALEPTTVYVRLNGTEAGDYEGSIIIDVDDNITTTVSVSGTVTADGIIETLASSVNVWNSRDELMIENSGDKTLNVIVYNIVGQPVLSATVANGSNTIRHNLAEGVYIVRIANGKEMTGIKVVVRR